MEVEVLVLIDQVEVDRTFDARTGPLDQVEGLGQIRWPLTSRFIAAITRPFRPKNLGLCRKPCTCLPRRVLGIWAISPSVTTALNEEAIVRIAYTQSPVLLAGVSSIKSLIAKAG